MGHCDHPNCSSPKLKVFSKAHGLLCNKSHHYHSWHHHKHHKKIHYGILAVYFVTILGLIISNIYTPINSTRAADSTWTQSNWNGGSGGVNTNTSTQYLSGTNVTTSTANQITLAQTANWFDAGWKYRKKITFDNTTATLGTASEAQTNFPVLVKLDKDTDIDYAKVNANGLDLRFIDTDGTVLKYEIEKWDVTGTSYIWTKVPQIDINSNTDYIWMYYGNTAATTDTTDKNNVWEGNFKGVWHLDEASGNNSDSTVSNRTATVTGASVVAGKYSNGRRYSGSNDLSSITSIDLNGTPYTVETWVNFPLTNNGSWRTLTRGVNKDHQVIVDSSGNLGVYDNNGGSNFNNSGYNVNALSGWHHFMAVGSGTTTKFYLDGAYISTSNFKSSGEISYFGNYQGGTQQFGIIDEFRIATAARSAAWVAASYKSENDQYAAFAAEEAQYLTTGSLISNIYDSGNASDWGVVTFSSSGVGTVTVKARTSDSSDMSGATDWATVTAITSGQDISNKTGVTDTNRYIQYGIDFVIADVSQTPTFTTISITYSPSDNAPPPVNATVITLSGATNGQWTGIEPTINWTATTDNIGGLGLLGYCVSLNEAVIGNSNLVDPANSSGKLTDISDGVTHGALTVHCPYIVPAPATSLNLNSITGLTLTSDKQYYFSIRAIDMVGNIYTGIANTWQDLISFKYDGNKPTNPQYVSASPSSYSSVKEFTFLWPTTDSPAAADTGGSLLAGYQYKLNNDSTWYGSSHTGASDDIIPSATGTIALPESDYDLINEGQNIFYLHTLDFAGNISASTIQVPFYYNASAPKAPTALDVTPDSNTTNSFAFSWSVPAVAPTSPIAGYYYIVNPTFPITTENQSLKYTTNRFVAAYGAADQQGENTFYVIAKDEAGNANLASCSSIQSNPLTDGCAKIPFIANTPAPGAPIDFAVSDLSVRTVKYKVALSWTIPVDQGIGVVSYKVYRKYGSEDWTYLDTRTTTDYTDNTVEAGKEYSYKVTALDSASKESVASDIETITPKGTYKTPAAIIAGSIKATVTSKTATITWQTDPSEEPNTGYVHTTDSTVAYGKTKSLEATAATITQTTSNHSIPLENLEPDTIYYYQVMGFDENGNKTLSDPDLSFKTDVPTTISDRAVTDIRQTTAVITWKTNRAATTVLNYGKSTAYGDPREDSALNTTHVVMLAGLDPGTKYYYRIQGVDASEDVFSSGVDETFETLPYPAILNITFQPIKTAAATTIEVMWNTNVDTDARVQFTSTDASDFREEYNAAFSKDHKFTIGEGKLKDQKTYVFKAVVRDRFGNEATSENQSYTTPEDTRPPVISNFQSEVSVEGSGDTAKVSAIITWDTDEPADSQVFYGTGTSGNFDNSTGKDTAMASSHMVVISDLKAAQTYHVKAASADKAGNIVESDVQNFVTNQPSQSVISIILTRLQQTFGWMTSISSLFGK